MGKIDIKLVHSLCLGMAKELHRICVANDIPYFMISGTLLGSVRHKGFIPWDDDMDFGISRPYYAKAIACLKRELKSPYKCITNEDNDSMLHESCKIVDTRTVIHEDDNYSKDEIGVFIDLFPYDYSDGKTGLFSNYMLIKTLVRIQNFRFTHVVGRSLPLRMLSYIVKLLLPCLKRTTIPRLIRDHLVLHKGDYCINNCGLYGIREIVPVCCMTDRKLMPFEDTELFGVSQPEKFLTPMYGDYMQLPPEEKRKVHLLDIEFKEDKTSQPEHL